MTSRRAFLGTALAGTAATFGGCGYALVGKGTVVDPDVKRIGVPPFKNSSAKAGLDVKIGESVIAELLKRGRFDVVPNTTNVNAVVEGEIVTYRANPLGFSPETAGVVGSPQASQATRYEILVTAKVRYAKVGATEPIWAHDGFTFRDEYDLGSDPSTFLDRESQAIDRVSEAFARSLVAQMLEAF
jgi:hypothetical protein